MNAESGEERDSGQTIRFDPSLAPPKDNGQLRVRAHETRRHPDCRHVNTAVDIVMRTITCDDCGANVDPFHVLELVMNYDYQLDDRVRRIEEFEAKEKAKAERARRRRAAVQAANGHAG